MLCGLISKCRICISQPRCKYSIPCPTPSAILFNPSQLKRVLISWSRKTNLSREPFWSLHTKSNESHHIGMMNHSDCCNFIDKILTISFGHAQHFHCYHMSVLKFSFIYSAKSFLPQLSDTIIWLARDFYDFVGTLQYYHPMINAFFQTSGSNESAGPLLPTHLLLPSLRTRERITRFVVICISYPIQYI